MGFWGGVGGVLASLGWFSSQETGGVSRHGVHGQAKVTESFRKVGKEERAGKEEREGQLGERE